MHTYQYSFLKLWRISYFEGKVGFYKVICLHQTECFIFERALFPFSEREKKSITVQTPNSTADYNSGNDWMIHHIGVYWICQ